MVWASKERKGAVNEEAKERARSPDPKCEMSKVLGRILDWHLADTGGREEVVQAVLCVTGFKFQRSRG